MLTYEIKIEEADKTEVLEKNYRDIVISIIASSSSEGGENEQSHHISESINGGAG